MSFIDGIVSGVSGFVKDVFNIDDEPAREPREPQAPKRSKDLAVDSSTTFERAPSERTRASSQRPAVSLLETIAGPRAGGRRPAPETGIDAAPHVAARTATEPERAPLRTAARATVRDAATRSTLGTVDDVGAMDADAAAAAVNVQRGLDYYASTFGRSGLDGAGSGVDVLVDDRSRGEDGAERFQGNGGYFQMADPSGVMRESIHFGTGTSYRGDRGLVEQGAMQHADDLTIHELTHGVIRKETGHLGGDTSSDEAAATNEGIADVMAAAATRDWRIGEDMYTERSRYKAMRDIANPDDPTAIHGLFRSMSEVEAERARTGEFEEHWASGVVSTAAYRVQQRLGGGEDGWRAVEQVFYDTIDNARLGDMSFQAVAAALRTSAATVYGDGSSVDRAFDSELRAAGL